MKAILSIAVVSLALSGAIANAETSQERAACESDAFRVCGAQIPNAHNVFLCLMSNQPRLSLPCQQVMARYAQPNARAERAMARPETDGRGE